MSTPRGRRKGSGQSWSAQAYIGPEPRVEVIGIGVQKAATSWLFRRLVDHPELRGARRWDSRDRAKKEVNFFNHHYERGYAWYEGLFEAGPWANVEFSILYFHDLNAPARAHRYNPGAKLLLSLRDPVERAFSHHKHEVRNDRLPPSLHEFGPAAARNPSYLEIGEYATHLSRWLELFDRERIHVVDYGDIESRPDVVMEDAFTFLDVDSTFRPERLEHRVNRSVRIRSPWLESALKSVAGRLRGVMGHRFVEALKIGGWPDRVRRMNRLDVEGSLVPPLDPHEERELRRHFSPEIDRLSELLGRDFSHWQPS